jgi:hypothetical protein
MSATLWASVRELLRPILLYWVFLGTMYAAFCTAILIDSPSTDGLTALLMFGLVTAGSVALGQVMAILRLRDWIVYLYWAFMWTGGMMFGIFSAAVAGPAAILVFIWVFFSPFFVLGGLWSLRVNRGILASWVPLIYAVGTALTIAEGKGKVATWKEGSKWAVWDVFTFSVLGAAIVFMLAYLVMRETHRLHRWRSGPLAPLAGTVRESGDARPRLTIFGWMLLGMLGMGLAVGTAAISPYLWRTGPADGDGSSSGEPGEEPAEPQSGQQPGEPKDPRDQARQQADTVIEQIEQDMQERMEESISLLGTLLLLLLLFLGALLTFWRPGRRLLTVRHCRDPLWTVPTTTRIEQGWRLVEIALADIGVPARPGEPAESLYARAAPALEKLSGGAREVHGLLEAARIRDRVAYGLGVAPGEAELMARMCTWAYDTVWDRLGDRGQLKALYRGTPSR